VLAIMFGANFCYVTPMAYQTNLLVMSAGGYRFSVFVRGGQPLLAIMLAAYALLLPRFYPLCSGRLAVARREALCAPDRPRRQEYESIRTGGPRAT
jgi:hypothetical protein